MKVSSRHDASISIGRLRRRCGINSRNGQTQSPRSLPIILPRPAFLH